MVANALGASLTMTLRAVQTARVTAAASPASRRRVTGRSAGSAPAWGAPAANHDEWRN